MVGQYQEKEVTLDRIKPGPHQARRVFDRRAMGELVQSIQESGLINPPIVFAENGHYCLLAGERRSRALCAIALATDLVPMGKAIDLVCGENAWEVLAGYPVLARIQVPIRVAPHELDLEVVSAVENLQRVDLNPIEEGETYRGLLKRYKSLARVSRLTGRSAGLIKARVAALDLDEEIRQYMAQGQLSKDAQVIEALLSLPTAEVRLQLARRFVEKSASIRMIVAACEKVNKALEQTGPALKPLASVPVSQVSIQVSPTKSVVAAPVPPTRCFCPDCANLIQSLAEELCGECMAQGLSAKCLQCPGVIEFIETLMKRAEGQHV